MLPPSSSSGLIGATYYSMTAPITRSAFMATPDVG